MADDDNNMEPLQRVASDEDVRLQDQRRHTVTDRFLQMKANSPLFDFQDSNLSPTLSLLPSNAVKEANFSEYSLFHQSESEFAPLRPYPDISMASEKFHIPPHDFTTHTLDQTSLSQHPLAEVLSEEGQSSCCSLSQHSLSPEYDARKEDMLHSNVAPIADKKGHEIAFEDSMSGNLEKLEDTYFLSKDVPAQQLIQILQKDVGMLSSSCSTTSSSSYRSAKKELKSTDKPNPDQSLIREGPPGEASVSRQQPQTKTDSFMNESKTRLSDVFNVTVGSRSTKPDNSSEALRQELLLDAQGRSSHEAGQKKKSAKTPKEYTTSFPKESSKHMPSVAKENLRDALWTGSLSTELQQRLGERDLWLSGNQTGIDGSYLGFLPQSQSTPGVFKAPPKSSIKSIFQQLYDIDSNRDSSIQSSAEISLPPPAASPHPETKPQIEEEPTSDKVQLLPSLNYMQKVDAWRANQNTGKTSLFDSLALQGFNGIPPKKKAYNAVSDRLNQIFSQQVAKISQNVPQNPSMAVSSVSSQRREEAVGSAPSDKDNRVATQPTSPFNRSQSHSSLSTVVMSVKKEQATEARIEKFNTEESAEVQQHPTTEGQLSPLVVSLGQFSDVTLSNSQGSSNCRQKVTTSIGTSSVSLEVDNYDPYWTAKLSTPPPQQKPGELNIEERIPLYLQNLGIVQSPSTILTPFAPRGPIREPEFSPTELCTIKDSTPTKSIQPSEGGTPHKAEFSRSSLQSVDSSVSIPLSTDGQVIRQELFRPSSSSSNTSAAIQSARELHPNPTEDVPSQPQRDSSESPVNSGPMLDQDKELESHPFGPSAEQNAEISFVGSNAFSNIHILSQAEDMVSPRSSAASDRFLPQRKESSFTSAFTTEESKSQTSHLWTRSSSDSVLTTRDRLTGGENIPLVPAKQSCVVRRSSGLSLILNKSVQRAEPEGCSAAPPDRVPPQPPVNPPPPSTPIAVTLTEEIQETTRDDPVQSRTSSPVPVDAMSDRSSESSLAIRVAKLLQTESPATMMSSTNSVDQEEGKAREWILQMVSGQKCEPLELDQEDRRRIEEIKRELLLKNPKLGYASTDTESSAASSLRDPRGPAPHHLIEPLPRVLDSKKQLSQHSGNLSTNVPQPNPSQQEDIVARVREIAAREGVTLPKTRALTSITISTCRRSTSPSPSTSPAPPVSPITEPLHLNQLTREEDGNQQLSLTVAHEEHSEQAEKAVALDTPKQKSQLAVRQDTVGGHFTDSSSSVSLGQDKTKSRYLELVTTESSPKAEDVTTKSGHISQVCLTLSPKPFNYASDNSPISSQDLNFPQKHFVQLGHYPSTDSSPDEGVGLSSPPEWHEVARRSEKIDTNKGFTQPQRETSSVYVSPTPLAVEATVLQLLPYKPHGSEELFYVPQTEADSSTTTMESTHTDSDDALPPHFSSDVLGQHDPGLDRGVTIRHTEGIYSKRLTKPRITMTEPGHRASPDAVNEPSTINTPQTPKSTSPVAFTRAPLSSTAEVPTTYWRDQGTSPVSFFTQEPPALERDTLQTGHSVHFETHSLPNDHMQLHQDVLSSTSQINVSTLDQLWQRFTERWSQEESRPVSDREASLLERLERLSRLIHSTRDSTVAEIQQERFMQQKSQSTGDLRELKKQRHADKDYTSQTEWRNRHDLDSVTPQVAENRHLLTPAERDSSDTVSSTSMSTVDTARLVRAFGADRVQRNLRTSSSSLSKLYKAISKQKEQGHERTGHRDTLVTPLETSRTDESSVVVDSASSISAYTQPPHRGPSKSLVSKKAVKLVSKGIQAGDLEIVSNATRRHTRDVGTTFPSPSVSSGSRQSSSSSSQQKSPSSETQRQRRSQKNPVKLYSEGISWFISADELKAEARKENEPEPDWRPSSVWFEPFSKKHPWREPLRQRRVEDERNTQQTLVSDPHLGRKKPSSLAQDSLQNALLEGRPDFVSRSRQRLEQLALQVEERRLQALLSQEREELVVRPGGQGRLPRPAGTAHLRRAIPRKEMIQRSKQIYENLPEVRRRKEEERRKAEYRSYRLNAQLYNKRITNRVLGRRTAWQ